METAVIPVSDNAIAAAEPQGLGARLATMPTRTLVAAAVGVVVLVALLVTMAFTLRGGDYKVLFTNLGDKEGLAVITKLDQMGVDYKFAEGGGAILVPAARVHELRAKLGNVGVNRGNLPGYELLDGSSAFGQSDSQQRMQAKRAVEGELSKVVQSSNPSIASVRVLLGLPNNSNGFYREQQKPTASVSVQLHSGRVLDRQQIAGIVSLVAGGVPELNPKAVSVIADGVQVWPGDDQSSQGIDSAQLRYVKELEAAYLQRVTELLEPVVGRGNLRATITADVDFTQTESTAEEFKPNQGDQPATVQAARIEESNQSDPSKPSGVPGAVSNQPPTAATAPLTGASAPLQGAQTGAGNGNSRRESETKYAVDRTVRLTKAAVGTLRRVSAAVVVNHKSSTDAKGKTTTTALTDAEIEKLTALVQQGIGFNQQRGDSVRVVNAPFQVEKEAASEAVPFYLQPWFQDLMRAGLAPGALALVALVVVFALIRPALKAATTPPPAPATPVGGQLDAVVSGDEALPALEGQGVPALDVPKENSKLVAARALAKENPAAVANIVRTWVSGEEPA